MGLMTHLMVSHTWSIKGKTRAEGSPSHLSFEDLDWTQPGFMSHSHQDLSVWSLMLSYFHPHPWFFIISQNPHLPLLYVSLTQRQSDWRFWHHTTKNELYTSLWNSCLIIINQVFTICYWSFLDIQYFNCVHCYKDIPSLISGGMGRIGPFNWNDPNMTEGFHHGREDRSKFDLKGY